MPASLATGSEPGPVGTAKCAFTTSNRRRRSRRAAPIHAAAGKLRSEGREATSRFRRESTGTRSTSTPARTSREGTWW